MTLLMIIYVTVGLVLSGLSWPLIWRKIGPNPFYGLRIRQTLDDPAVWYPVNAFAGKGMLCVGLGTCVAAVATYFMPGVDVAMYASVVVTVVLGGLGISLVLSFR
jgi:uncharacterized membrane protein